MKMRLFVASYKQEAGWKFDCQVGCYRFTKPAPISVSLPLDLITNMSSPLALEALHLNRCIRVHRYVDT